MITLPLKPRVNRSKARLSAQLATRQDYARRALRVAGFQMGIALSAPLRQSSLRLLLHVQPVCRVSFIRILNRLYTIQPGDSSCATCSAPESATSCTSCPIGSGFSGGICTACSAGQFWQTPTSTCGSCLPFEPHCSALI